MNYEQAEKVVDDAIKEIANLRAERDRLQRTLRDHLDSEAAETMRANTARFECDCAERTLRVERAALARTKAERDRLAEALETLLLVEVKKTADDRDLDLECARHAARAALAEIKS